MAHHYEAKALLGLGSNWSGSSPMRVIVSSPRTGRGSWHLGRVSMDAYVDEALYHLRRNDWIVPLRRGLYALSSPSSRRGGRPRVRGGHGVG